MMGTTTCKKTDMAIKKYLDWRGWLEGLYLSWVKSLTTTLMALCGTNAAEQIGVKGIGMSWEQAFGVLVSVSFWEVIRYLNAKPKPDEKIGQDDDTTAPPAASPTT